MSNKITIVTAFFDIGRGQWTPDKGLPHYLKRSNETYLERFSHMATLDNEMVIFTSTEFEAAIKEMRADKPTHIITLDFPTLAPELREEIVKVQQNVEYQSKINPTQVKNPEYWNVDYVMVNLFKSTFVHNAISAGYVSNDTVAWLDFGYCRDASVLNGVSEWKWDFAKNHIHLFNIKDYIEGTYIQDIIFNNDVHITGPCIVADKKLWSVLGALVKHSTEELLAHNLIDDDQTILLTSYLMQPELFELHKVSDSDWFIIFKDYNDSSLS